MKPVYFIAGSFAQSSDTISKDIPKASLSAQIDEMFSVFNRYSHTHFILYNMATYKMNRYQDMKSLLRYSRTCRTTDSRGKGYAFIGLADPSYGIKSDYRSSVSDVYIEATARILLEERKLDITFEVIDEERNYILPSWVTDWPSQNNQPVQLCRICSNMKISWILLMVLSTPYSRFPTHPLGVLVRF